MVPDTLASTIEIGMTVKIRNAVVSRFNGRAFDPRQVFAMKISSGSASWP